MLSAILAERQELSDLVSDVSAHKHASSTVATCVHKWSRVEPAQRKRCGREGKHLSSLTHCRRVKSVSLKEVIRAQNVSFSGYANNFLQFAKVRPRVLKIASGDRVLGSLRSPIT